MYRTLVFGLLSFAFSAYAYYPYFKEIKNGDAHPTISTWICWLIIDGAILAGMIVQGEVAFQVIAYVFGVLAVLTACIQTRAPLGWWWLDTFCVAVVALAMAGWAKSGDAKVAIVISIVAFIISCFPMVINVYKKPHREPIRPWLISWVGATFGVMAIPTLDITGALTPAVFFILGLTVVLLICRKFLGEPGLGKMVDQILLRD